MRTLKETNPLVCWGEKMEGADVVVLGAGEPIWRWWDPFHRGNALKLQTGRVFRAMVSS